MTTPVTPTDAIKRGRSIIPIGLNKKPISDLLPKKPDGRATWKPYQKRRATAEEFKLWMEANPPAFAIVTGEISGIVTLDFDGARGVELAKLWGIRPHRRSGSGGLHWDVQHPGWHVPTLNGKAQKELGQRWPGLDVKGDGGYVIAFGRNAAGRYEWLREADPDDADLVTIEVWEFLRANRAKQKSSPDSRCGGSGALPGSGRVDQERLISRALDQVSSCGRNNSGFWLAGQLRDNEYAFGDARSALLYFVSRCPPTNTKGEREPYTEHEALASLRQAYSRPAREPWGLGQRRGMPQPALEAPGARASNPSDRNVNGMKTSAAGLPRICANGRQLRDISNESLAALQAANDPLELFSRGNAMVAIIVDEKGRKMIAPVGESALRGRLARAADFYRVSPKGDRSDCAPPIEVVRDILSLQPAYRDFPFLEGLVEAPVLRPDGTILDRPGYDPGTGLYYAPDPDLRVPEIAACPTSDHIDVALSLIMDDVLVDFPFVDDASKTNAIAGMLTAIVKSAIKAPTPLQLNDAPQAGTGKSLYAEVVSIVSTGRPAEMFSAPKDEDEWRKQLTTALLSGTNVVVFDNISRRLDSPELCKVLTATQFADREFRTHEKILLPVNAIFIATGNNIQLGGDMPRRCYHVRLDSKQTRPFLRTGFKHPDLKAWVKEHRGELLAALLTLARAWYVAGKPKPKLTPLGGFEAWSITIGGILEHAGVSGFLGNAISLYEISDQESLQWEGFLSSLHEVFEGEPFTVAQIAETLRPSATERAKALRNALPDFLAEGIEKEGFFNRRAGKCFADRVGKRFGESGVHLKRGSILRGKQQWEAVVP